MPYDPLLMATILLLFIALVATLLFYGRIRRAHQEYENAKDVVGDVVISFDRQMQRQEQKLGVLAYKTETLSSKSETLAKRVKKHDGQLRNLTAKVEGFREIKRKVSTQIDGMDRRIEDIVLTQKRMTQRIEEIEKLKFAVPEAEARIEAAFPIKKERALAPLTETELIVLEILAKEGGKTAPEIKDKIRLTREHTARLMKKLYENGYLERDAKKIPYAYCIKKEMLKILRKTEAKA